MRGEEKHWIYWLLAWGMVASLGILAVRVFKLAVIEHGYYSALARENRIYEGVIPAGRGEITDRKGRVVARSVYQYFKKNGDSKIYQGSGEFEGYKFEGKDLAYELKRQYPYAEAMGLLTGYVSMVSQADLKEEPRCEEKLNLLDVVGRSGVEGYFDCQLRGKDGKRLIEVDARGKYVRELGREEPGVGGGLQLSIDAFWQEKIYKLIEEKRAVVILSVPKTGEILAMVSSPSFDPNVFSYEPDSAKVEGYLKDNENLPLLNRAVAARYHPGSVFKIVVAMAGLESRTIDSQTLIEDTGVIKIGDYSYNNWLWTKRGATDGMVDVVKALKRSNDIFFYKLGELTGVEKIDHWARVFGFGARTGVELWGEVEGIVPNEKWKMATKGEKWYLGNTYHLAIGQGDLSVTPLQVNQMTNIVASGGVKCEMSLIKGGSKRCKNLGIDPKNLQLVIEGMEQACREGGTAWPLFNFKTKLACKTGTAEVGDGSKDTHAWLTAFAPAEDPQVSITVLVERGGEGSDEAAPIVGDILKEWLEEPNTVVPRYDPTITPKNRG